MPTGTKPLRDIKTNAVSRRECMRRLVPIWFMCRETGEWHPLDQEQSPSHGPGTCGELTYGFCYCRMAGISRRAVKPRNASCDLALQVKPKDVVQPCVSPLF